MAMTYQQQFVLDGAAGRDAILNVTARHNRCHSTGDRSGWIATFRHSGARFTRDGTEYTRLATCTVLHRRTTTSTLVYSGSRCCGSGCLRQCASVRFRNSRASEIRE